MSIGYDKCGKEVREVGDEVLKKYRGELVEAKVSFDYMFARANRNEAEEIEANPIVVNGYKREAKVKIIDLKNRVAGRGDVEILIDEDVWNGKTPDEQVALLDSMFDQLELKKDSEEKQKLDDLGRPMLRIAKPLYCMVFSPTLAERHGFNLAEVKELRAFSDKHGQTYFGWDKPPMRAPESAVISGLEAAAGKGTAPEPTTGKAASKKKKTAAVSIPTESNAKGPTGIPWTVDETHLTVNQLNDARQPGLLEKLRQGGDVIVSKLVELAGRSVGKFVVVMPPAGSKADWMLIPLLSKKPDTESQDEYDGCMVKAGKGLKKDRFWLGPPNTRVLVAAASAEAAVA